MISNQAYPKSWTSYFIGQTRSKYDGPAATIQSDGTVKFHAPGGWFSFTSQSVAGPALGNSVLGVETNDGCGKKELIAYPVFSNSARMNGLPPDDWAVGYGYVAACNIGY